MLIFRNVGESVALNVRSADQAFDDQQGYEGVSVFDSRSADRGTYETSGVALR